MANIRKPRKGSMGVWPRKRANRSYPRVRSWSSQSFDKPTLLGFCGYKAGMTHLLGVDNKRTSLTKGEEIVMPATIIECPAIKILSARFYKKNAYGMFAATDFFFKPAKELQRKISLPKNIPDIKELDKINPDDYADISIMVYTQPKAAGFGKKKPEIFELKLSGTNKERLEFIKANADKELAVDQAFKEAQFIDVHAVTKGKGIQGPVKRFGIALKPHKTEKGRRQPGSRGPWRGQQHIMYRTAYSGQMGYHQRFQMNLQVLKIGTKPEEINPKDGFSCYGKIKSSYMLVKGSVPGAKKRLLILTQPLRAPEKEEPLPTITHISLSSKQGR
ncbi:MAG TPA: 50S ribosomal protein L3 [Candidatus Nanoarchaeia archaeon]|nr:50S ribosomal protein L3 [Candidatus Nanoarchaeia archaeon]